MTDLPVTIAEGIHIAALLKYRPETGVLLRELMGQQKVGP